LVVLHEVQSVNSSEALTVHIHQEYTNIQGRCDLYSNNS